MNPILQLKLKFSNERNQSKPQGRNLSSKAETSVEKIENLIKSVDFVVNTMDEPYIGYTASKISRIYS